MSDKDFFLLASVILISPHAGAFAGVGVGIAFFAISCFLKDKP